MLNKNQSKRWNSWKYAIIVPVLAVFMWQFQVKVVAQEKESPVVAAVTSSTIRKEVTAKSTDAELKELETLFKEKHNASLTFSKVKRNKAGEIIALKAVIESKGNNDDNKGTYQVSGTNPIKPFTIIKYNDSKGKKMIGFGEPNTVRVAQRGTTADDEAVVMEAEEIDNIVTGSYYTDNQDVVPPTPPTPPLPPAVPNFPTPPAHPTFPTPPTPPSAPPTEQNKKAWKKFEEQMKKFEEKMNSVEMKQYEKAMQEFDAKMSSAEMKEYEKDMEGFDLEMRAFDKEMRAFEKEMQEYTRQIQEDVRIEMKKEREAARKERDEMRKIREKEREKAQKEREAAQKERK